MQNGVFWFFFSSFCFLLCLLQVEMSKNLVDYLEKMKKKEIADFLK